MNANGAHGSEVYLFFVCLGFSLGMTAYKVAGDSLSWWIVAAPGIGAILLACAFWRKRPSVATGTAQEREFRRTRHDY